MPHSSGGGSSHGGSHHGSSHSSGGSSSHSSVRTSHKYFKGSHVFVRYHHGRPQYRYCDSVNLNANNGTLEGFIWMLIIFTVIVAFAILGSINIPKKLNSKGVQSTDVEILDYADVLGDTHDLLGTLNEFKSITGIIPVVVTVPLEEWKDNSYDLETYAYNWYVSYYRDEKHWLIMYSEDTSAWSNDKFGNWYFEGMQGDDTDNILTTDVADEFTDELYRNLLSSRLTRAEAIQASFEHIMPNIMKSNIGIIMAGSVTILLPMLILIAILSLIHHLNEKRYAQYTMVTGVQMNNNIPLEDQCVYCDGIYVVGTVLNCPHCGAPVPMHNPINK